MDRYLLIIFGVLTMLISSTSCIDQEEVDITYHHDVTAEVNPFALYEESGIDVQSLMAADFLGIRFKLNMTVLVYNKDGSLNQRIDKTVDTPLPFTMDLSDLDEDEYTIVAIQHMSLHEDNSSYNDDEYNEEDASYDDDDTPFSYVAWELENTSNINDVRVKANSTQIPWFMCLGIQTQEVSVRKGMTIKIATELTGSFVDFTCENLNYSNFNWLALCFGGQASGLYLNPELQGNSKYYYEDEGFFDFWSVVDSYYFSNLIDLSDHVMFFLGSGRISYCFKLAYFEDYDDINTEAVDFFAQTSYDDTDFEAVKGEFYSAFCYYNGETDSFTTYMGLKSEFKQWYDSIDKWNKLIFEQPYVEWGASIEEVKRYMEQKHYSFSSEWDEREDVYFDDDYGNHIWVDEIITTYWLAYEGKYLESSIYYQFDRTGNLIFSSVSFWNCNITEILEVFNSDTRYTKIEGFKEIYEHSGRYIYVNDSVQAEIYQNKMSDGTMDIEIEYRPRSISE